MMIIFFHVKLIDVSCWQKIREFPGNFNPDADHRRLPVAAGPYPSAWRRTPSSASRLQDEQ